MKMLSSATNTTIQVHAHRIVSHDRSHQCYGLICLLSLSLKPFNFVQKKLHSCIVLTNALGQRSTIMFFDHKSQYRIRSTTQQGLVPSSERNISPSNQLHRLSEESSKMSEKTNIRVSRKKPSATTMGGVVNTPTSVSCLACACRITPDSPLIISPILEADMRLICRFHFA